MWKKPILEKTDSQPSQTPPLPRSLLAQRPDESRDSIRGLYEKMQFGLIAPRRYVLEEVSFPRHVTLAAAGSSWW